MIVSSIMLLTLIILTEAQVADVVQALREVKQRMIRLAK